MGSLEAHNGRWGAFTDFIYLDFGGDKSQTRKFTIGDSGLPVGTTADLDWNLEGHLVDRGRAVSVRLQPGLHARCPRRCALARHSRAPAAGASPATSARCLRPAAPAATRPTTTLLDGIVGLRGRCDARREGSPWSVPFYVDIGTGDSKRTWQAAAGIRYAFQWGEVSALWRVLDYELEVG